MFIFLISVFILGAGKVSADWWDRPSARPTQPSVERTPIPTTPSQPTEAPASEPTVTSPPNGGVPTSVPTSAPLDGDEGDNGEEDDGDEEDPCAPGKSYTGSHCGWSPGVGEEGEDYVTRIGGPFVLGLSDTSGENLDLSDIMLLGGVLCLLLYVRSKTLTKKFV